MQEDELKWYGRRTTCARRSLEEELSVNPTGSQRVFENVCVKLPIDLNSNAAPGTTACDVLRCYCLGQEQCKIVLRMISLNYHTMDRNLNDIGPPKTTCVKSLMDLRSYSGKNCLHCSSVSTSQSGSETGLCGSSGRSELKSRPGAQPPDETLNTSTLNGSKKNLWTKYSSPNCLHCSSYVCFHCSPNLTKGRDKYGTEQTSLPMEL